MTWKYESAVIRYILETESGCTSEGWSVVSDDWYGNFPTTLAEFVDWYRARGCELVSSCGIIAAVAEGTHLSHAPSPGEVHHATFRRSKRPPAILRVDSVLRHVFENGAEADVPEAWRTGTDPDDVQPEQCYREAFRYFVKWHPEIDGAQLVHGSVVSPHEPRPTGHAWVELPSGVVFDGVLQRFYAQDSYYDLTSAAKRAIYTRCEACTHAGPDVSWYGPWRQQESIG